MERGAHFKLANGRSTNGSVQTVAMAAAARAASLLPLLVMPTFLVTGCLVVPIPDNRCDPAIRANVSPQTVTHLGTGDVSRTEVLLQLGEPDEVAREERQFRYHTERIKWDIFWVLAGGYNATWGNIEVRKYYDLVLRFDEQGKLFEGAWLDGWSPGDLRQKARWVPTGAPPENLSEAPATPGTIE